jgi:hypothetical protein
MVMGFDLDKTAHHFYLYEDGGAIDIAVKDAALLFNGPVVGMNGSAAGATGRQ